jgi:hypothetical protein
VGGIWEFADPITCPGYTEGLVGTPNELKLKALVDTKYNELSGEALNVAISNEIKNKKANLVGSMESHIKRNPNGEFVISNPVNPEENFADKWPTHPKRKENFFKWLRQVKSDVENIMNATGLQLRENVGSAFGEEFSKKMLNSVAD